MLPKSAVLLRIREAEEMVDGLFSGEEHLLEFRHLSALVCPWGTILTCSH